MEVAEKIDDTCRLCDEISEKMFGILEKNEEGIEILQVIKDCLPIIIYRTDPLSKQICESCLENLNSLNKFKKNALATAEKQKENMKDDTVPGEVDVGLFLGCDDIDEALELKDASTSTDDLTIFCNSCKQAVLDGSTVNGELELCTDLHKAIAESLVKNKVTTESASEKSLRRRKVVPFYNEMEDSLCSSLTEFTHNTEGSQCFEEPSDMDDSVDSDEVLRPSKRRRIESDDESQEDTPEDNKDEEADSATPPEAQKEGLLMIRKPEDINGDREEEEDPLGCTLENMFVDEQEYRYEPLSLLQLALNVINKLNIPDYEPEEFFIETIWPKCSYCGLQFQNLKILAIHEASHIDVEMGEKIDNPVPWHRSREFAEVRNKWLNYFDENGYEDEDIVIEDVVSTDNLLIPVDDKEGGTPAVLKQLTGDEKIELVGTNPMVNNVYLGDYSKDDRKLLYQSMRVQGVNKKFCPLCRYTFKDNWAIESHYFSLACFYTCRYCGMRFNKQRHKFTEHVEEHTSQNHEVSDKVFAASKLSNIIPKVIHPPKPRRIVVTQHNPPPEMLAQNNQNSQQQNLMLNSLLQQQQHTAGQQQPPSKVRSFMERKTLQPNLQIKEEPQDSKEVMTSQSKTGNQAYFCRKCYKVFFKLDEFNIHSKNCDYNQFPQMRNIAPKPPLPTTTTYPSKNGEVSPTGRPMRNCTKEIGPYKDEAFLPDSILKEPKQASTQQQQSFVCFICNTPFPTIYSRNSHMRIHKGETQGNNFKPRIHLNQYNYRLPPQHPNNQHNMLPMDAMVKQEPMDTSMEPMVEIHESPDQQQSFPDSLGGGAVSITPISKNPKQKPIINPNVMKIVQNNPQLSMKKSPEKFQPEKFQPVPPPMPSSSQLQMGPMGLPDPDRTYKCSSCWEAFANKSHLYFHKKNQCEGSRLPCPFCKKRFGTEAEYSSHIYYSHPE
ncbi:hypothetical protein JTB14_003030 [Gonioctena quinquepunctata]|nr:hypothetical protein JTB14_003030 [Gonioctena quinquepunctata]